MKYPNWIVKNVRENLGLEPDDDSRDNEIATMSRREVFERWLTWQGIIGYGCYILDTIEEIWDISFEEIENGKVE